MKPTDPETSGIADLSPLWRSKEQHAWYWYDWANSAYVTTVNTVLLAPYFIAMAKKAAEEAGTDTVSVLGVGFVPDSLYFWLITASTIIGAFILPPLGAIADRTANKKRLLGTFAWIGAAFGLLIVLASGSNWTLAALGIIGANFFLAASMVINDSILPLISTEQERDRVSSRGWAWGYLGGGLLLAVNLVFVTLAPTFLGGTEAEATIVAAKISMLSAIVWWAGFTLIPVLRLTNHEPQDVEAVRGNVVRQSFGQLAVTFKELRQYPMAVVFLLAYLFFNDGIQTVINASSAYGSEELGHTQTILMATILMVQFVAYGGALLFGRLAEKYGAKHTILGGLVVWMVIVTAALFLPAHNVPLFLVLGFAIGVVLGGTQALARSYFSLLVPKGKEAEYFAFYHAMDRGTSWFGAATMAIMLQLTDSYRPAVFALIVFFVLGGLILARVDTERGIREAGNAVPSVV